MATDEKPRYYGLTAIRRSFGHFVLGKGLSAVSSLIVLVVIIRQLSVAEFAVWASLHALVLMLGLVSSFGVNAVLLRFLPELRAAHNNRAMYRLLAIGMFLRVLLYLLAAFALLWFVDALGGLLKMGDFVWLLPWYLLVGLFRVNATFAIGALESLLWQREAQYSLAIAYLCKLAATLGVLWYGTLTIETFILIECAVELLSLILLLASAFFRWRNDPEKSAGDSGLLAAHWRRYVTFGLWAYTQNLTSIFYGSAPNRLIIGYFLPIGSIAVFGTVDRLITYIRRYEPLLIFLGMVRPIFNSRFTQPDDFPRLVSLANGLFRLNLVVLLVPFILFAIAGGPLFDWLTAGKYVEAAAIFLGFYVVLILGSANPMLDVLIKLVEKNRIYTLSNLTLSASIGIAIPLIPHFGLWALALANGMGMVISLAIILSYLKRVGYGLEIDWHLIFRIVAVTAASVLLGHLSLRTGLPVVPAVLVGYAAFFLGMYLWPGFRPGERALLAKVLKHGKSSQRATGGDGGSFSRAQQTYGK